MNYIGYAVGIIMGLGLVTAVAPVQNVNAVSTNGNLTQFADAKKEALKGLNATSSGGEKKIDGKNGILKTVTNVLLFIIGAISVIMIVVGGIKYTTSNGDEKRVASAKNTIMYAVVGLVIAIFAYGIVAFVIDNLG